MSPGSKTFLVSKTFEEVTPESAEEGEASDRGFVFQDEIMDEEEVVHELRRGGYIYPSSSHLQGLRWVSTEEDQDYSTGAYTTYSLHIEDMDGSDISSGDWKRLLESAGLLAGMHLSSNKEAFLEEFAENAYCPACGGEGIGLGRLGATQWFRCRNCGIDFKGDEPVSAKMASEAPNTNQSVEDHQGDAGYKTDPDPSHKISKKTASELKVDASGSPPNTTTATQDHDFELKALASQLQSFKGKLAFDPNDPLKD
jgi:ribosomal protein L37AE/L43A